MINIGFAGFRHSHIYAIMEWAKALPDVQITAAWEEDSDARIAARRRGIVFNRAGYEQLLADTALDIVAVGDYYARHGKLVIDALRAGKHVITDKPLCTNMPDLREIQRLTEKTGLCVVQMLDLRWRAASVLARTCIQSGKLGEVRAVQFGGQHALRFGTRESWYFEKGKHGGTINDIAVHGLDLLRDITGCGVETVLAARMWNAFAKETPHFRDSAQFMATLTNGAGLLADVSYAMPDKLSFTPPQCWRFTFWCDGGILEFDCARDEVRVITPGAARAERLTGEIPPGNPLTALLAEMRGSPDRLCTQTSLLATEDALRVQRMADNNG